VLFSLAMGLSHRVELGAVGDVRMVSLAAFTLMQGAKRRVIGWKNPRQLQRSPVWPSALFAQEG
jgi:hypothetical protein